MFHSTTMPPAVDTSSSFSVSIYTFIPVILSLSIFAIGISVAVYLWKTKKTPSFLGSNSRSLLVIRPVVPSFHISLPPPPSYSPPFTPIERPPPAYTPRFRVHERDQLPLDLSSGNNGVQPLFNPPPFPTPRYGHRLRRVPGMSPLPRIPPAPTTPPPRIPASSFNRDGAIAILSGRGLPVFPTPPPFYYRRFHQHAEWWLRMFNRYQSAMLGKLASLSRIMILIVPLSLLSVSDVLG